jgi:hypothetical protein
MVEKGVHERVRLTKIYEKRREELERQHEEVRLCLEDKKNKVCYSRSLHFYTYQYIRELLASVMGWYHTKHPMHCGHSFSLL